jgi:carboxypeptidase D
LSLLAYYNAGSAALILLVVFLLIGAFLWCRRRRKVAPGFSLPLHRDTSPELDEESIPLRESMLNGNGASTDTLPSAYKGKARANEPDDRRLSGETLNPPIFDVGAESDDEDGTYEKYKDRTA